MPSPVANSSGAGVLRKALTWSLECDGISATTFCPRRLRMFKPIAELARDLAAGTTTSAELTEMALERIEAHRAAGDCAFLRADPEAARQAARASDLARGVGIVPSALAGIPISIKDLFDVAGQVTTAGSKLLRGAPA